MPCEELQDLRCSPNAFDQLPQRLALLGSLWLLTMGSSTAAIEVCGRIVSGRDGPVAGARVELVKATDAGARGWRLLSGEVELEPLSSARTGADGGFSLRVPRVTMAGLRVSAPGSLTLESTVEPILSSGQLPPVSLPAAERLTLTVLGEDGRGVTGALVLAVTEPPQTAPANTGSASEAAGSMGRRWRPAQRLAVTGAGGTATLPRLENELLRLVVVGEGLAPTVATTGSGERAEIRLGLGLQSVVEVRDDQGRPVASALVATSPDELPLGWTDARGQLELRLPAGGEIEVLVLGAGGSWGRGTLTSRQSTVAVSLRTRPIAGRILDAASRLPIEDAWVWSPGRETSAVRTNGQGRFWLDSDADFVRAAAAGFLSGAARSDLKEPPVGKDPWIELMLEPFRPAFGAVVNSAERPVVGAQVLLLPASSESRGRFVRQLIQPHPGGALSMPAATTGDGGRFELDDLRPGRYDLAAQADGYAPTIVPGIEVPSGAAPTSLGTVLLEPGATLEGSVVDPTGQPVDQVRIAIRPVAQRPPQSPFGPKLEDWNRAWLRDLMESSPSAGCAVGRESMLPWKGQVGSTP